MTTREIIESVAASAAEAHARYPQYEGHWATPDWQAVEIVRDITTKMGLAFVKGERTIGRPSDDGFTAYSVRNGIDTAVRWNDYVVLSDDDPTLGDEPFALPAPDAVHVIKGVEDAASTTYLLRVSEDFPGGGATVEPVLDADGHDVCPNCRNDDPALWADDGEADDADYMECHVCGAEYVLVRRDDIDRTRNGVAYRMKEEA